MKKYRDEIMLDIGFLMGLGVANIIFLIYLK